MRIWESVNITLAHSTFYEMFRCAVLLQKRNNNLHIVVDLII